VTASSSSPIGRRASSNRDPILAVLQRVLPVDGLVLELGSGTGEHAVHFARHLPALCWQPSDADPAALASITDWVAPRQVSRQRWSRVDQSSCWMSERSVMEVGSGVHDPQTVTGDRLNNGC